MDKKIRALTRAAWRALPIFEAAKPDDDRPRRALDLVDRWLSGEAVDAHALMMATGSVAGARGRERFQHGWQWSAYTIERAVEAAWLGRVQPGSQWAPDGFKAAQQAAKVAAHETTTEEHKYRPTDDITPIAFERADDARRAEWMIQQADLA